MKKDSENWDLLSARFNTHAKKPNASAVDQMLIAWPVLFDFISKYTKNLKRSKKSALDFGCGTGGFCNALAGRGFDVTGIDSSKEMISIAKQNSDSSIRYFVGNQNVLASMGQKFNLVSSIMVLQFIEDIDKVAGLFSKTLEPGGVIVLVVINPAFVKICIERGIRYSEPKEKSVTMTFDSEISFKVFPRDEKEYEKIFADAGFEFLEFSKPPFPKDFAENYGWKLPIDLPEFLILVFRKK